MRRDLSKLSRRAFLAGTAVSLSGTAVAAQMKVADLRGSIDSADLGLLPNASDDQTVQFQNAVNRAVDRGRALFLPAGTYPVANLRLPSGTLIVGVPGRTRLVYQGGGGQLVRAEGVSNVALQGITFDGANRSIGDFTEGLLHFVGVRNLALENCDIAGSSKMGVVLDRCSGRVENCRIYGAAEAGLRSNEADDLAITGNTVTDCANGGIWVHRWREGEDGTIVSGNRIERIGARYGGTGQFGNGINVFPCPWRNDLQQPRHRLCILRDPLEHRVQCPDPGQLMSALGRVRDLLRIQFSRRGNRKQYCRRRYDRDFDCQFHGWRPHVCLLRKHHSKHF